MLKEYSLTAKGANDKICMEGKGEPKKRIRTEEATEKKPIGSNASIMNNCINIKVMYTNAGQF